MRYPLVDGQGNFGSVDGDSAGRHALHRGAPAAPSPIELLRDIDKETVDFGAQLRRDAATSRIVLPAACPNLLVNGSAGIAVGMATNIPPHNLGEVVDAHHALIDNPDADDRRAHGAYQRARTSRPAASSSARPASRTAYATGRGSIRVRGKAHIEQTQGQRTRIIITRDSLPGEQAALIENIADLVHEKKITEICDLRDESDRKGMRVVIELKRDGHPAGRAQQALQAHPAADELRRHHARAGRRRAAHAARCKRCCTHYIEHPEGVVIRRTKFELARPRTRAHILEGLLIALDNIDEVIRIIRNAPDGDRPATSLIDTFGLTEPQTHAILDMRLAELTGLERDKIEEEHAELLGTIEELRELLGDEGAAPRRHQGASSPRSSARTTTTAAPRSSATKATSTSRTSSPRSTWRSRSPRPATSSGSRSPRTASRSAAARAWPGMNLKEEDDVEHLFIASTHDYLLFFTSVGKVYRLKVHELPLGRPQRARASHRQPAAPAPGREDRAVINTRNFEESDGKYLIFGTQAGVVKKTLFASYNTPRKSDGIIAIDIREGDELLAVRHTSGDDDVMMISRLGQAIRFHESDARPIGRNASGVRGMKLRKGDEVISMDIARDDSDLFVITENGFGKRTPISEYRITGRGGIGVRTIALTDRKGYLVGVKVVRENHEIMLQSRDGVVIRVRADGISRHGRATQGVKVMNMREGDVVSAIARMVVSESGATDEEIDAD